MMRKVNISNDIERLRQELYCLIKSTGGYKLSEELINKSRELDELIAKYQKIDR
ncbi:MAG: Spo0E family sporulation regulatory protein-aspartic acid phosphatase [Bacillota bacterium]